MNGTDKISSAWKLLENAYGDLHWWPGETGDEILIGAILTQNTSWTNVVRSIGSLKENGLLKLDRLASANRDLIARLIRSSGFFNQKAERLIDVSAAIVNAGGFDYLRSIPSQEAEKFLLSFKGIGRETAESILCYILGRDVFVVDKYTMRIFQRVGIAPDENRNDIRKIVEGIITNNGNLKNFHALLVKLGKEHCKTKPVCQGCPVNSICDYYDRLTSP